MDQFPLTVRLVVKRRDRRVVRLRFRFLGLAASVAISIAISVSVSVSVSVAIAVSISPLAKVSVEQHKPHPCRVIRHRLGRDRGAGVIALMCGLGQRPFPDVLREQCFHDLGQLGHDLGIKIRVVNPPVGRADGDRPGVVERADSGHLHDGNPAVLGDGKFRPGKLEC